MEDFKPTMDKPTESGNEIDKKFNMNEVDELLNEKEQSLKKKIFDLAKMETLVHNDEKLSAIYNEMADKGEEKYGYHYNETIMNIMFNDHILNNPKYLAKYRATQPKKKSRRDKYGVKDLKKKTNTTKKEKDDTNETTTAGSSGQYSTAAAWSSNKQPKMNRPIWNGGAVIGESNYLTDPKGFKSLYQFINETFDNKDDINEHHLNTKEEKVAFILKNAGDEYNDLEKLDNMSDEEIDNIYLKIEKNMGISESNTELNEHHLENKEDRIQFIIDNSGDKYGSEDELQNLNDNTIEAIYLNLENEMGITNNDDVEEPKLEEKAKSENQQQFMGMVYAYKKGELDDSEVSDEVKKAAEDISLDDAEDFASTKHDGVPEKVTEDVSEDDMYVEFSEDLKGEPVFNLEGKKFKYVWAKYPDGSKDIGVYSFDEDLVYNFKWFRKNMMNMNEDVDSVIDPLSDTMASDNEKEGSMKMSQPKTNSSVSGGVNEEINLLKKEMEYLNQLSEDRRTSSLINLDRLKKENEKNFKSDTKKAHEIEKATDQYEDVGDSPKKKSEDIEKEVLKKTKGEAFKNVGNSTNKSGDEIPKRNINDEENEELESIRDGMHSIAYDSKPDERFEEKMKDDMGDDMYEVRQKRLKAQSNQPMYNKDEQPIYDGEDKDLRNKYDKNLKESFYTGKYKNDLKQNKFISFKYSDVNLVESVDDDFKPLVLDGVGNFYDKNIKVNENSTNLVKGRNFYYKPKSNKVVMINKTKRKINESNVNSLNNMKKLLNYNPSEYIDTTTARGLIK